MVTIVFLMTENIPRNCGSEKCISVEQSIPPIVIAIDGIWEARNPNGEMFGKDRIQKIIRQNASASANEIQNSILESLRRFQKEAKLEDDLTLVIIKIGAGI